jgi:stage IV sporulation protein FB
MLLMLAEPAETAYDLRFVLFNTPVRVHPLFWLISAIFGWPLLDLGFLYLFLWIVCCFVSILLHELGHVWMGRAFGSRGSIVLYGMGGLAIGASDLPDRWKRVCVYLAGPLVQLIAIFAPLYAWRRTLSEDQRQDLPPQLRAVVFILLEINLFWPLLNLLPVWPLDGGKVSREFCTWISRNGGLKASLVISITVAVILAINSIAFETQGRGLLPYVPIGGWYLALFFGLLAIESWQLLQQARRWQPRVDERLPWESDPDAWKR